MRKKTKKICSVFMLLCITLMFFSACGKNEEIEEIKTSNIDTLDVVACIKTDFPIEGDYMCCSSKYSGWKEYASEYYRFDQQTIESIYSFSMVSSLSASADEYVVIKTVDTEAVKSALENFLEIRIGDFTGYVPAEAEKLAHSKVVVCGDYVALLVNSDKDIVDKFKESVKEGYEISDDEIKTRSVIEKKARAFSRTLEKNNIELIMIDDLESDEQGRKILPDGQVLIEEVPGVIEPYDTSHIVEAYKTGNDSILTDPNDIAVLKKVKMVIKYEIRDDMTEYEKERAIHDYIISNTKYDKNCLIYSNWYSEFADQPYGCLVDNRAICLGYATTFKLFMDILDIECVIVKGAANYDRANHAWNLVKLEDGNWYAVDVTWDDDNENDMIKYTFFNTDDACLKGYYHYWKDSEYPAATGGKYSKLEN